MPSQRTIVILALAAVAAGCLLFAAAWVFGLEVVADIVARLLDRFGVGVAYQ
jgi:hypothetical protein